MTAIDKNEGWNGEFKRNAVNPLLNKRKNRRGKMPKVVEVMDGNTFTHEKISYTFSEGTELTVTPDPQPHNGTVGKGHGKPPESEMDGKPEKKVVKITGTTCYWYLSGGKWISVCFP